MKKKVSLFLDSGAFSAWSKNIEINLQDYIDYIKKVEHIVEVYATLDVIGNPEKTYENQLEMERQGLNPIITLHKGEDMKWLKLYLDRYDYIALGGIAGGVTAVDIETHLNKCWEIICDTPDRKPRCKVHGFGLTSLRLITRYPWYSVDSTSWVMTSRFGSVYVPRMKNGKYVYVPFTEDGKYIPNLSSWKVCVSERSPSNKEADKHITSFTEMERRMILKYLDYKGFKLGKSEFKEVGKGYELKEGESWFGKEELNTKENIQGNEWKGKKSRTVEIIIEPGLCNDYKLRDELNIIYFSDLQEAFPEEPWSWTSQATPRMSMGLK